MVIHEFTIHGHTQYMTSCRVFPQYVADHGITIPWITPHPNTLREAVRQERALQHDVSCQ